MKSRFSTAKKQLAIAKIIERSVNRMNNDESMREDAERFGECKVAFTIKGLYGKLLGDFHGSYINGAFKVNIRESDIDYDATVTVTEDAFMGLCTGQITPEYAYGTGGICVEGRSAYKLMVVGIAIGSLIYNVLKE